MSQPPIALLIEDADEFALLGRQVLEREGYQVFLATDGLTGVELARKVEPELMLIDINLPGMDGFEVCRSIREFSNAYVMMVTARSDDVEKVVGFRVGADEYVTKPYNPAVLSARIAAMRRRRQTDSSPVSDSD